MWPSDQSGVSIHLAGKRVDPVSRVPYEHGSWADVAVGVAETEGEGSSVGDTCHGRSANNQTSRPLHQLTCDPGRGGPGPPVPCQGPLQGVHQPGHHSWGLLDLPQRRVQPRQEPRLILIYNERSWRSSLEWNGKSFSQSRLTMSSSGLTRSLSRLHTRELRPGARGSTATGPVGRNRCKYQQVCQQHRQTSLTCLL